MKTEEKVFVDASLIVYLNIPLSKEDSEIIDSFYHKLLGKRLYTDILALDEALYVSKKKYRVPYEVTDFDKTHVERLWPNVKRTELKP